MSPRKARMVFAGLAVGFGFALVSAPAGWADPAVPTTPPSETSTTDELTDMVLDALEDGPQPATSTPPRPAQ